MKQTIFILAIISALILAGCSSLQSDPFGSPPKDVSPNCGPEHRYSFNLTIGSKEDFVNFIKSHDIEIVDQYGNKILRLDEFKDPSDVAYNRDSPNLGVDWDKVLGAVKTESVGKRTIYILDYLPNGCHGYTLKMTNDGYVSVYGCCGA